MLGSHKHNATDTYSDALDTLVAVKDLLCGEAGHLKKRTDM